MTTRGEYLMAARAFFAAGGKVYRIPTKRPAALQSNLHKGLSCRGWKMYRVSKDADCVYIKLKE